MTVVPIAARRSRSPRRRAPEIIDAAARVFAERGFHGATTQDIADVLGIRQASLYYYFPSKEGALELVCLKGVEGFVEAAKTIAGSSGSAGDRLEWLIRSHLLPLIDRIGRWSRGLERIFEDVIKDGVRSGEFRHDLDTRLATLAILGMANAAAGWYRKEEVPIERIADAFARLVLDGMIKPRSRRTRRA
jgi:AcrR family transcriptional regulator